MNLNALDSQNIADSETLSQIYLPNQACWKVQLPIEVTKLRPEANSCPLRQTIQDHRFLRQTIQHLNLN